jgi:hypothetical protein
MEKITWPAVVAVIAILAAVVALVWLKQDLTAIGVLFAGLLGALFVQQSGTKQEVAQVSQNTNGNNRVLVEAILTDRKEDRELLRQILLALPPNTALAMPKSPANDDTQVLEGDILE